MMFPRGLPRKPGFLAVFVECVEAANKVAGAQVHVECSLTVVGKEPAKNWTKGMSLGKQMLKIVS